MFGYMNFGVPWRWSHLLLDDRLGKRQFVAICIVQMEVPFAPCCISWLVGVEAGFVFTMPKSDPDLDQLTIAIHHVVLAAPKGHPLTRLRKLRLRDLRDTPFIWFPRQQAPAFYDQVTKECARGGLKILNIVQEVADPASMLSFVSCRLGVTFALEATRWRCPAGVVLLPMEDLNLPLPMSLIWRKDNTSPLLARFVADVQLLPEVQTLTLKIS